MVAQPWVQGLLKVGYCCFNRSSSISVTGVLLVMKRAWAQGLPLYRASCRAHYYPDLLKKKKTKKGFTWVSGFLPHWRNAAQYHPLPGKVQKPFRNRNANLKRSWLKTNRQACQTVFLGFCSLICWRCSLILNFCLDFSFQLAKMVTRKQHSNLIVSCAH